MPKIKPGVLLLTVFALSAGQASAAQEAVQDTFSDSLDVQAVNLQVVVTDRKGHLVPGLTAADFRLLVEGREVPLEYFAEVQEGKAVPAGAVQADAPASPALPSPPALEAGVGEEMGNSYLVFVDEPFSPLVLRNEALKALSREAATLRPQDRMAVVTFDGRRVMVLAPWTGGGEPLRRLLEQLGSQKGALGATRLRFRDLDPAADRMLEVYGNNLSRAFETQPVSSLLPDGGVTPETANTMIDVAMAKRELQLIQKAVGAASAAMRAFSAAPGRKVLMLLSGGWRYDQAAANAGGWERVTQFIGLRDGVELLQHLVDTSNLLGFTVYPVHLSHGAGGLPSAAERREALNLGSRTGQLLSHAVSQSSLVTTAEETGGKLLLPGRNRHLAKVLDDTTSYYWLGFTHAGDDRRRDLKVEVRRPGLKVRSRTSFVPLSRQARVAMEVESALMTGRLDGMEPLGVSVGELRKVRTGAAELPVTVRVPAEKLTLVPQSGRYVGRLELRIGTLDDEGDRSDVPVLPIEISQPQAPKPGSFVRYDATLELRFAPQDVQFVLYDLLSGESFGERVRVEPKG
ncbi:MAG TPA: VWA domain-containing protein [Thermoanaerobaculia bacterium]|nr:VWA domain-containing protein [Thermoanaerobaculia bacterium]